MLRNDLASRPVDLLSEGRADGTTQDVVGFVWQLKGMPLLVLCSYLRPSQGLATENRRRLAV